MIKFRHWLELVSQPISLNPNDTNEEPTAEDYNFYHAHLSGRIDMYLKYLIEELEKKGEKLNLVRKGYIVQEVMDSLGLNPNQVQRLSVNIKKGIRDAQASEKGQPKPVDLPNKSATETPDLPKAPLPPKNPYQLG